MFDTWIIIQKLPVFRYSWFKSVKSRYNNIFFQ